MPTRVYKTNKDQLLAEGKIIVSSTEDSKYQHKVLGWPFLIGVHKK